MRLQGDATWDARFANRQDMQALVQHTHRVTAATADVTSATADFTITRELTGDLPEGVSLIGGAVSARATVNLDAHAPGAPSPAVPADRAGWVASAVKLRAGYQGMLDLFDGTVREFAFDEPAGERTLTLVDGSDRMRATLTAPPFGSYGQRDGRRWPALTNASAVIVAALHASGIRFTPPPSYPDECVLSWPLAFGYLADKGWAVPPQVDDQPLVQGKFGWMPQGDSTAWQGDGPLWDDTQVGVIQVEAWAKIEASDAVPLRVRIGSSNKWIGLRVSAAGAVTLSSWATSLGSDVWTDAGSAGTVTTGWHHVAFEVTAHTTGGRWWVWIDGTLAGSGTSLSSYLTISNSVAKAIAVRTPGNVQAVHAHNSWLPTAPTTPTFPPVAPLAFASEADVDKALLDLETVSIDGRQAWEVVKGVASAEYGTAGFDESGRFRFRNRVTVNAALTPVATWGSDLADGLAGSVLADTVVSRITSELTSTPFIWAGRGAETEESTAIPSHLHSDPIVIPASGITEFLIATSDPVIPETAVVSRITASAGAYETDVAWVLCDDAAGASISGVSLAARLIPLSPRTWILRVRGEGITRYAVWPQAWDTGSPTPFGLKAGDTAFWINGYSLSANNARVVPINRDRPATRADWGDRVYRMEQSEWRQDAASVEGLADALLADLAAPRLELRDISVPPDLRWEIGDVVTLTDWAGRVPDITARITRIQLTIAHNEESGMRGVYSLRALPPVAPTITAQPSSTSVAPGTPATFTAAGTGEPAPTVTWQVNDGSGWHDA